MDKALTQFLKPHIIYTDNENKHNFSSQLRETPAKYVVPGDEIDNFWDLYSQQLYQLKNGFISGLSERPREFMPILGDIDISFFDDDSDTIDASKHFYSEKHVKHVVSIYIDVLKYLVEGYSPENLYCFVLEKSRPHQEETRIKNGFHLHFPFLYLSKLDISANLHERVRKRMEEECVFKDIGIEHSGDLVDRGMENKYWLLYGSRKAVGKEPYLLTRVYNHKCVEVKLENIAHDIQIFNSDDDLIDINSENVRLRLPQILSINSYRRSTFNVKKEIEYEYKRRLPKADRITRVNDDRPVPEILDEIRKLMPILSTARADRYDTWMECGWALYCVGEGCQEALDMWIDFSSRTTRANFSEETCIKEWKKMTKGNWTIGSFKKWAREDNNEQYEALIKDINKQLMKESLEGSHYDLARQLHIKYCNQFKCASIERNRWFEFRGHMWVEIERGYTLRTKIANDLVPRYIELGKENINDYAEGEQDKVKKINETQMKIGKLIGNLKNTGFKDQIMKECCVLFYDEQFLSRLNSNQYLLGFTNGILDLKALEFRDGRPEDYVTMSVGYEFKTFNDEDPEIYEIKTFLTKIFPDPELRTYFVEYGARLLKGGNTEKNFLVMSGEKGDNGKSVTIELIQKMLGQYAVNLPTTLITQKRGASSAASPELARCSGVRFAVLQEPDGKDMINGGTLKELTGSDAMFIRGLFKDGGDVRLQFKVAFICNKLPKISSDDQAIWNRVRVLTFESVFPKDKSLVPDDFKEQLKRKIFERDDHLNEKFDSMKQALMWVFYQTYIHLRRNNKKTFEPKKVTEATKTYRQNNDFILQFINEMIKEDHSRECCGITLTEVYNVFKDWYRDTFAGMKVPSKNDVRDELNRRWGFPRENKWKRYRLRNDQDDIDEGIVIALDDGDFTDCDSSDNNQE